MRSATPTGWPKGVHPPASEEFERTAVMWLFELVPPEYRLYGVLRRYPVVLARHPREHVTACLRAARDGYRTAHTDLDDVLSPRAIEAVLDAYRSEGRRLATAAREVALVEEALHARSRPR